MSSSPSVPWRPKVIVFDLLTAVLDSWSIWNTSILPNDIPFSETPAIVGHRWRKRYLDITFSQGAYTPYERILHKSATDVGLSSSVPKRLVENWSTLQPWPEVPEIMAHLREMGCKLATITNCSKELGELAVSRLEEAVQTQASGEGAVGFRMDAVVTAEESGYYKPVAKAYEAILPRLASLGGSTGPMTKEDVLFVAGSAGDVQGATDFGFKVVWNNHVGLAPKGKARALQEGRNLELALEGFFGIGDLGPDRWADEH